MDRAKEVAELLTEDIKAYVGNVFTDWESLPQLTALIAAALREYAEQQVKEAREEWNRDTNDLIADACAETVAELKSIDKYAKAQYAGYEVKLTEARSAALEEAEKIAAKYYESKNGITTDCGWTANKIADEIRRLREGK